MCHSENRYGDKQNKNRWGLKTVDTTRKTNISIIEKTVGDCKIPIIFNLQHNNDENVTSIITHNRVEINLRYIRNP